VHWDTLWTAVKDVLLTGTGMVLILSQVFSGHPSDVLLVTGLALTAPSVATHARTLLAGPHAAARARSSSPPSGSAGPSPSTSSSPEEATGEHPS
jgi:hypothetical protein